MGNCASCSGCGGGCSGCNGCARELTLTREEMDFLQILAQFPFLPVGRALDSVTPVYLEEGEDSGAHYSRLLELLEKKGLISLDYDLPLKGYSQAWYLACPLRGSMALTQRGQQVLELLEYQGAESEKM